MSSVTALQYDEVRCEESFSYRQPPFFEEVVVRYSVVKTVPLVTVEGVQDTSLLDECLCATPDEFLRAASSIVVHNHGVKAPPKIGSSVSGRYGQAFLEKGRMELFVGDYLRGDEATYAYTFYHELGHLVAHRDGLNYVRGREARVYVDVDMMEELANEEIVRMAPLLADEEVYNLLRYNERVVS